ncbi:hypothetical protein E4U54_005186 [Claviceps lovelessii]|nr:hypothetical protein E4U54_005186 [Claviceps lovelessii]
MPRYSASSTTGQLGSATSHASSAPGSGTPSGHGPAAAAAPSLAAPSARLMLNRYVYETRRDFLPFSERLQQMASSLGQGDKKDMLRGQR